MSPNWSCPDGELVLTVRQAENRPLWLAERRKGIGSSDASALMGESRYATEFDVWLDKTGRVADRPMTLAMEMGMRMEAAIAEKFSDTFGLEIRRRGMLRYKSEPLLLINVDRLAEDDSIVECKSVNGFFRMPKDLDYRQGWPNEWYWQGIALLLGSGRRKVYLAVGIGNADFQVRSLERDDPEVQADMARLLAKIREWWPKHVVGDEVPEMGTVAVPADMPEKDRWDFFIPEEGWEIRDRLREIRETAKALKEEGEEIKAKLQAEAGGARWLYADGRPILEFNPRSGRASFNKRGLFGEAPVSGHELTKLLGEADWLTDEQSSRLIAWLLEHRLTEAQFTTRGDPSTALLIVGDKEEK